MVLAMCLLNKNTSCAQDHERAFFDSADWALCKVRAFLLVNFVRFFLINNWAIEVKFNAIVGCKRAELSLVLLELDSFTK